MFTLRCTKKLLDRVGHSSQDVTPPSTTALGDWTANMVILNRQQLVVAVSSRTLLPVILPLAPAKTLPALVDVALHLADAPCGPLRGERPSDLERAALAAQRLM